MELLPKNGAHRLDGVMLERRVAENVSACFERGAMPAFEVGSVMAFPMSWVNEKAPDFAKAVQRKFDEAYWETRKILVSFGLDWRDGTWRTKDPQVVEHSPFGAGVTVALAWTPKVTERVALETAPRLAT